MTEHEHRVVFDRDPRHPLARSAYCAKAGCGWRWDGIGSFTYFQTEHENLNRERNNL